jgi:membrane protease subunit HflC
MKKPLTVVIVIAAVFLILLSVGPFYIVEEGQQAVVIRFGQIVSIETEAGLKVKTPFVDQVTIYPKKIVSWDGSAQIIPTRQPENQFIWVDTTARWKIIDPTLFYESVGTLGQMQSRLDDLIDSAVRSVISRNYLIDAIRNSNEIYETIKEQIETEMAGASGQVIDVESYRLTEGRGRETLAREMGELARQNMTIEKDGQKINQFGVELIDVLVRQIKYSDDLTESVYQRMIQERTRQAQRTRSEGRGEKDNILGRIDREVQATISQAERQAEEIKGQADAEATRVYAAAYQADPEFFRLWRSLESYKELLPKFKKTLSTDAQYFDYLYRYAP